MCLACQIKVADSLTRQIFMPDITASLREHERREMVAKRERKQVVAKITGGEQATGFVYYIRINGQIKIGYTKDITQRMRNYPPGSELLAMEGGTPHTEKERHQDFKRDLERGREWFRESPKLAEHIKHLRETLGNPESLSYKFTTPTN